MPQGILVPHDEIRGGSGCTRSRELVIFALAPITQVQRRNGGGIDSSRGPSGPPYPASDTGLLDYAWVLSQHRRLVFGIPVVAVILTLLLSLVLPTRWTAKATFIPESQSSIQLPQGIGALAGELGFSLPGSDPTSGERGSSAPVINILKIEADDPRERTEKGVEWLKDHSAAWVRECQSFASRMGKSAGGRGRTAGAAASKDWREEDLPIVPWPCQF